MTNKDVGPTPYWILIFDEITGNLIGKCSYSYYCSVTFTPQQPVAALVAFVAPYSTTLPPDGAVAASNTLQTG